MDKALTPYVKGGGAHKYEEELKRMYGATDGNFASNAGAFSAMTQDALTVQYSTAPALCTHAAFSCRRPSPLNCPCLITRPVLKCSTTCPSLSLTSLSPSMRQVLNDVPFSIPPYFALLARAIVTLEGIALTGDPNYGIILESYPFVARKLLSEDRPEIQKALQGTL
jgi:hypothetical protein